MYGADADFHLRGGRDAKIEQGFGEKRGVAQIAKEPAESVEGWRQMKASTPETALMREFDRCAITGQAAERGGNADGAAGIGADGGHGSPCLHTGVTAAGRAAGQAAWIAGLDAVTVVRIFSGDPVGELMQVRFADDNRALRTQARRNRGVRAGDSIFGGIEFRSTTRGEPFEIETVFQRDGQAVQRRLWICSEAAPQDGCVFEGAFGIERNVDIVAGIAVGADERIFGDGFGRSIPCCERLAQVWN